MDVIWGVLLWWLTCCALLSAKRAATLGESYAAARHSGKRAIWPRAGISASIRCAGWRALRISGAPASIPPVSVPNAGRISRVSDRTAQGRLSEVFGNRTLKIDELLRRLDLYTLAQASVAAQDQPTNLALEAYSAGVNACFQLRHSGAGDRPQR